jgi:hypothetical protein
MLPNASNWKERETANNDRELHRQTHKIILRDDTDRIENEASNNSSITLCFRCHGNMFGEPLPSTEWRDTLNLSTIGGIHLQTNRSMGGIYKFCR